MTIPRHIFENLFSDEAVFGSLILYLIGTPFNAFANRADPYQAALVRAA